MIVGILMIMKYSIDIMGCRSRQEFEQYRIAYIIGLVLIGLGIMAIIMGIISLHKNKKVTTTVAIEYDNDNPELSNNLAEIKNEIRTIDVELNKIDRELLLMK